MRYCLSHWIYEDFVKHFFLSDASWVMSYALNIFKANLFLPDARSNEELALFSLKYYYSIFIYLTLLLLTSFFKFCLFWNNGCKEVLLKTALKRLFARNLCFSTANNLQISSLKGVKHPGSMKFNHSSS